MGMEIERKFLVHDKSFVPLAEYCKKIKQGYLAGLNDAGTAFRVRIIDNEAFLTIKGKADGICRAEFEYPIPVKDAEDMLANLCGDRIVEKCRYYLHYAGNLWEIDVFGGRHEGLVVAEIELADADCKFEKPSFVGEEVSDDFRYTNLALALGAEKDI